VGSLILSKDVGAKKVGFNTIAQREINDASPKGNAGLERWRVRGHNLEPRPPANTKADVSETMFWIDVMSVFLTANSARRISLVNVRLVTRALYYKIFNFSGIKGGLAGFYW
jgi:hypothetical protein